MGLKRSHSLHTMLAVYLLLLVGCFLWLMTSPTGSWTKAMATSFDLKPNIFFPMLGSSMGAFGTVLSLTHAIATSWIFPVALLAGLITAFLIPVALRANHFRRSRSTITSNGVLGYHGRMLVATKPREIGYVRLVVREEMFDLQCVNDSDIELAAGARVVVVWVKGKQVGVLPSAVAGARAW